MSCDRGWGMPLEKALKLIKKPDEYTGLIEQVLSTIVRTELDIIEKDMRDILDAGKIYWKDIDYDKTEEALTKLEDYCIFISSEYKRRS